METKSGEIDICIAEYYEYLQELIVAKNTNLTQLELFRATVAHEKTDQLLYYSKFTPDIEERVCSLYGVDNAAQLAEELGMFYPVHVNMDFIDDYIKPDFSEYYEDIEKPDGSVINEQGVLHLPGSMYHFTYRVSPLRNAKKLEDIEQFPFLRPDDLIDSQMEQRVRRAHEQGKAVLSYIGHLYENAWQVRGYEEFLMDMVSEPQWCDYIFDRFMEVGIARAEAAARAGVDYILTGDDVANQLAMMFDLPIWRKFIKSRWAKIYSAAKAIKPDIQIWYHSDGNIESIIPELIEIGVTILNPVQPECLSPLEIKRKYGDKLVLDGAIGTQTTMPFGSPQEVRDTVKQRIEELASDGGYIVSPTHTLEPEVPVENIKAFLDTCRNYRRAVG